MRTTKDSMNDYKNSKALDEIKLKFGATYDSIAAGISIYNKQGVLLDCNSEFLSIFGIDDKQQFIDSGVSLENDPNVCDETKARVFAGDNFDYEIEYDFNLANSCHFRTSLSGKRFLWVKIVSIRDKQGELEGYLFTISDRTEQYARQKLLEETQKNLKLALKTGHISAWKYTIENQTFVPITEWTMSVKELSLKTVLSILHPNDKEHFASLIDNLVCAKADVGEITVRVFNKKDNEYIHYEMNMAISFDKHGRRTHITGTQRDITESITQKRQLEEFKIKTKLTNEKNHIVQWDYDIDRQLLIIHGNGAISDGVPVTPQSYISRIHPDDHQIVYEAFKKMNCAQLEAIDAVLRIHLPDHDEYRYIIVNAIALKDENGKIVSYTGIRRDATEEILKNKEIAEKTAKTDLVTKASGLTPWEYDCNRKVFLSEENEIYGKEMTLEDYLETVHISDKAKLEKAWAFMRECKDESFSIDLKYHFKGAWEYATVAGGPYERDASGKVTRYLGYRKNTTEIVRMNEDIRESKFKTDMAMKKANMVMWEYSTSDNMIMAFNDPMTNYDDTKKYSPYDYIALLDRESTDEAMKALAFMKRQELGEFSFKSKVMLPGSKEWQYVTVHGSHSEVDKDDPTKATKYVGFRIDNTELTKLSHILQEAKALTENILTQSPSAIFIKDITHEWRYLIANELFCALFNYTSDRIIDHTDYEIFSHDVAEKFRQDDLKAIECGDIYSLIEEITTDDGTVKALHTTRKVITTDNGRQLLIGVTSDITKTIAQQRELEQANKKSELVLNNANTGLVYIDNDFRIMWENTESVRNNPHIQKYKRDQICYNSIYGLDAPCKNCVIPKARKSLKTEKTRKTFKDGTVLDIFATPVIGDDKQINGYVCRIDDVTKDVLKTRKLKDTQKYLDLAIDAGKVGVWGYNPKTEEVFNISGKIFEQEKMPIHEANKYIYPDDFPFFQQALARLSEGKSDKESICIRFYNPFNGELEYIDKGIVALRTPEGELEMIIGTHHDVTTDKMQKIALEDSNEKLNMALNVIQAFSWHCDTRDGVLLFDGNFPAAGVNPESMNSMEKFAQHIHPEDRGEFLAIVEKFMEQDEGEFVSTYRVDFNQNGNYEWWECRGKMKLINENGQTYKYAYGMDCNVTRHKQITDEITKAKTHSDNAYTLLTNIMQQIPFGLYIKEINNEMRYLLVNDKIAKYHNLQISDFVGKTDYEIMPAWIANEYYENNQRTISKNGAVSIKNATTNTDGEDRMWEVTEVVCTNTDGRKVLIGLVADISEREKNRIELQKSKEESEQANALLHSIIKQIPFGLYIKDINHDLRYVIINDILAQIVQIDSKEAIGKTDEELLDKETAAIFHEEHQQAIRRPDGELRTVKHVINRSGRKSVYENSCTAITVANGRRLLVGVLADITEKERMLDELKIAKESAEQSDKLKSAFLANMSHEIRTPLNAIVGFSELLIDTENPAEKEEYTNIISVNNELLLRLISDILDLSKIESGMIEFKTEVFDLSEICDEVYMTLKQKMTNPDIEFSLDNPYHSCIVELDKNRLTQVGINFITNAIKYTTKGHIKLSYEYVDNGIKIAVEDTGIGIAKENHDKMFRRFEKFDSFAQGTGLGLSICKAIMDAQGGKIGFSSVYGEGSTFWAWFPCEAQIQEKTNENGLHQMKVSDNQFIERDIEEKQHLKILVAEDNDSNYMLIKYILKDDELVRAYNGLEAVEKAKSDRFDAVLMDWRMPVMNGVEATKKIREFDTQTPIIAVTANAFDSDKVSILEAGCNAFLAKPLKKRELMATLNGLVYKKKV